MYSYVIAIKTSDADPTFWPHIAPNCYIIPSGSLVFFLLIVGAIVHYLPLDMDYFLNEDDEFGEDFPGAKGFYIF